MSTPAIKVDGLSKRYRIGTREEQNDTIIGALASWVKQPLKKYREIRKLQDFDEDDADDIIWALDDVNFEVDRGEVVGLIGKNGAGKSTLLKLLSRITDPTSGRAVLQGRVSSLLEVGTGFHQELTGRENVYLNGTILGMRKSEIDAKFDEIVEFSGVEKFIDTPVKRYSSGMKVRLGFAVAAHLEPEILLVDEVLAVGDVAFQKKCLGKMDDVTDSGRTVMFVSHNMGMIRTLCPRTILLEDGEVAFDGPTDEAIARYMESATGERRGEGEIVWDEEEAPGEEEVRLRAVRALDAEGQPAGTFNIDHPIEVTIDYDVLEPVRGMRIVMRVVTTEGVVAFASTDHRARGSDTHEPGRYRSRCTIPADLLNRGGYQIQIHVGIPSVKVLVPNRSCLKFTTAGHAKSGTLYKGGDTDWPGAITPDLDWSIQRVDSETTVS